MVRFVVFSPGKKPHGAVSCFFVRLKTAWCGFLFFRQAKNRTVRFAVFRLGRKPQNAVITKLFEAFLLNHFQLDSRTHHKKFLQNQKGLCLLEEFRR